MLALTERNGLNDVTAPVYSEFSRKLYTDHLEEIEYLLAQRLELLYDPEVPWPLIGDFEQRLLAHVHGTVIGRDSADIIAEQWLEEGDSDQMRGALFALANSREPQAINTIYSALENSVSDTLSLFSDALKHPTNPRITALLESLVNHERDDLKAFAIETLGYRREGDPVVLTAGLKDDNPLVIIAVIRSVRRLRHEIALTDVEKLLTHTDQSVAMEAALTLTTFGHHSGRDWLKAFCFSPQSDYGMAPVYLAQCGIATDSRILLQSDVANTITGIEALGILGDSFAVDHLLMKLKENDESIRIASGRALQLMTGADLTEQHVVFDKWEGPDGKIIEEEETTIERTSTDHDQWKSWWMTHSGDFANIEHLRFGASYSPKALTKELESPSTLLHDRQRAYYELLSTQQQYVPYEPDWFVTNQNGAIARLHH